MLIDSFLGQILSISPHYQRVFLAPGRRHFASHRKWARSARH